ncbi:MAG: phytanoyl-CoA dioxygenase family protein [Chloroflexi bacterium]|nr:phytanoyl-CoA dioxygenase family protein [Chloroflexota bacterium]
MAVEAVGMTDQQIEHFYSEGYVVVPDVFDPERDFDPLIADYSELLDEFAGEMLDSGEITHYDDAGSFQERLLEIIRQTGQLYIQRFDISLPQKNIEHDTPMYLGKAAFDLIRNRALLDVVESLIGPEIYSNPIQHIRLKAPQGALDPGLRFKGTVQLGENVATVTPWHQDSGVATENADDTEVISVWVPLVDVDEYSGCLAMIPRSNHEGLALHCPRPAALTIPDNLLPSRMKPVPMKAGSVLLFTRYTIHRAMPNLSDHVRFSFDLRYQRPGLPTGRGLFPGFLVRSQENPSAVLRDHSDWARLWLDTREALANKQLPPFNRWNADVPQCA